MRRRKLGKHGPEVSTMGLGCMGMSDFYGTPDEKESLATLDRALELGIDFWDTADMYGPHTNEELVAKGLAGRRKKVFVATKFGIVRHAKDPRKRGVNGKPDYVRTSCEGSLRRLKVDTIDLYYQHRVDPQTPIEDTVGAMARLVEEGKVRYLGLSEASAKTLERAHAVHPITALQSEYSLWSRDVEGEVLTACRRLGVALVAYSPIGRGFLSGAIRSPDDFAEDDYRRHHPRFTGDNFAKNLALVAQIEQLARSKKCTASQLALAWVLAQGDDIVPIPGTKRRTYLQENAAAADLELDAAARSAIERAFPRDAVAGTRYPEEMMGSLNG